MVVAVALEVTADTSARAMEAARSSHHQDQDPAFPDPLGDHAPEHPEGAKTATRPSTANANRLSILHSAFFEFIIHWCKNKMK